MPKSARSGEPSKGVLRALFSVVLTIAQGLIPRLRGSFSNLPNRLLRTHIHVIHGGPNIANVFPTRKIYAIGAGKKRARQLPPPITFQDEDLVGVEVPHEDPIVVGAKIDSRMVQRLLVDTGSSCDILFRSTLQRMGIPENKLRPYPSRIAGFTGEPAPVCGVISLQVEFGTSPCIAVRAVEFVVVDIDSVYNGIIGRPFLAAIDAVVSVVHLKVKFPTHLGIGVVKGDQAQAKKCYSIACPPGGEQESGRC